MPSLDVDALVRAVLIGIAAGCFTGVVGYFATRPDRPRRVPVLIMGGCGMGLLMSAATYFATPSRSTIPALDNLSQSEAEELLKKHKLTPSARSQYAQGVLQGRVVPQSQSPASGLLVPNGSVVTFGVSQQSKSWPDELQQELARLANGRVVFDVPSEMRLGVQGRAVVRISANFQENLSAGLEARVSKDDIEPLQIGPYMTVKLNGEGDAFRIDALTPGDQFVAQEHFTEWAWDIQPEESGQQKLHLAIGLRLKLKNAGQEVRFYPVKEKVITVRVNPAYSLRRFVGKNWQWLCSFLLIPLGGLWWKRRRERENATKPVIHSPADRDFIEQQQKLRNRLH